MDLKTLAAIGALFFLIVMSIASPVSAQGGRAGSFYIGLGAGVGRATLNSDAPQLDNSREWSFMGSFRAGWFFSNHVSLGIESVSWRKSFDATDVDGPVKLTTNLSTLAMTVYPGYLGFWFRGGAGAAYLEAEGDFGKIYVGNPNINRSNSDNGWGILVAFGWEMPLGKQFLLAPMVQYDRVSLGDSLIRNVSTLSGQFQLTWIWL